MQGQQAAWASGTSCFARISFLSLEFGLSYMSKQEKKMMRRRLANAYLSSVISISLVLLLIGAASLVIINSSSVSRYLKENMVISVLLVQEADEAQAQTYIKAISSLPYVRETRLVTKEEGEQKLSEMLGEDFLSVFESSPIPLSVDVSLKAEYVVADSLAFITNMLSNSKLVDEVDSQLNLVTALNDNLAKISAVFAFFILLLLFISFALISNMVRLNVFARRFTIHTMKLVGATKSFIRKPFMKGAAVQGILAAMIASAAIFIIYYAAKESFAVLFSIFETYSVLITVGIMIFSGVAICMLNTFFVVGKLVGASKDELYY